MRDVRRVEVVRRAVVHVAESVVVDRRDGRGRGRDVRGDAVVDSVQLVEDVLVRDVVESEDVRPFVAEDGAWR